MRIVIDLQGAQTESRFRGIGRYSLSFAKAVVRNRGNHEVILALSGFFPDSIEPIRAAFNDILPQENIRVWYAPGPVTEINPENHARRQNAELIREAFLSNLRPDIVHVTSLFEGFLDNGVSSIARIDRLTKISVSLYDLIPLLNPDQYLKPNPGYAQYYERKINHIKKADLLFSISEFSRQEGLEHLGIPPDYVINISTAIEPRFQQVTISEPDKTRLYEKFGLNRPFLLYTGGFDQRKNLLRLIQAFAQLPTAIRENHQLLLAGKISSDNLSQLQQQIKSCRLKQDEVCFADYVPDSDLVQLYNLCKLFVFPSWHEGFGLPTLEAMACGAPVIASNTSSVPEVVSWNEALFDPFSVDAIATKIEQALGNDVFLDALRKHGLQRAKLFSWDICARRAIGAWETLLAESPPPSALVVQQKHKPRLAFVSPLPPERTGIADYSAELLPHLAQYYDIELVVEQNLVDTGHIDHSLLNIRNSAWLRENAAKVDRVLYQMGNSPFHAHMLSLMQEVPGIVVLHDFYLSALIAWQEIHAGVENQWTKALYISHGYEAVRERYLNPTMAIRNFPTSVTIFQHAQGVITHSEYSKALALQWYGEHLSKDLTVIPFIKTASRPLGKNEARKKLGFRRSDFLICSFGFLGQTKLNHRLIESWIQSSLAKENNCHLIFVGERPLDEYGEDILRMRMDSAFGHRIHITGFVSPESFHYYLAAADIAVQLRTDSRGETSAAAFDCLSHKLPLIVNANGSMAELEKNSVWMLPDNFDNDDLVKALDTLWSQPVLRNELGEKAWGLVSTRHSPTVCALRYKEAIERFHLSSPTLTPNLIGAIAAQSDTMQTTELGWLAQTIAATLPIPQATKRIFLDITATSRNDLKTGIERAARALLMELIKHPPLGYRIEPIYLSNDGGAWHYRFASSYTLGLLGCPTDVLSDEIVEPETGDILFGLDLSDVLVKAEQAGLFGHYRNKGVSVFFMVYDLLPIRMPEVFPPNADLHHINWLQAISKMDGAICISSAVAEDLKRWQAETGLTQKRTRPFKIEHIHLGADLCNSAPTAGPSDHIDLMLAEINSRPSFLMVGTIEPRKGHLQVIEAFEQLWKSNIDVNLIIVGKEGWKAVQDDMRRNIPELINCLEIHTETNKRLLWIKESSDEDLEKIYAACTCLIAASFGEGFGLPLIEAAQYNLPIIARDIPVFREVAGDHAFYFRGSDCSNLAGAIQHWLALFNEKTHPVSTDLPWLTWEESAEMLVDKLLCTQPMNVNDTSISDTKNSLIKLHQQA